MRQHGKFLVVIGMLGAIGGLGCEAEPLDASDDFRMEAPIGPEGGAIVGAAGTALEGVALHVPAGALAETAVITVEAVIDDTPLPEGAERVGPQFRVVPETLSLGAGATLILPVDVEARRGHGAGADEVRVWVRTDDAWRLVEPLAFDAVRVQVPLERGGTTAAAGVRLSGSEPSCGSLGLTACGTLSGPVGEAPACLTDGSFCVQQLPLGAPIERSGGVTAVGHGALVYQGRDPNGDARLVRLALPDLSRQTSGPVNMQVSGPFPTHVALDRRGDLWLNGTRFGFDGRAPKEAFTSFGPLVAATGDGRVIGVTRSASTAAMRVLQSGIRGDFVSASVAVSDPSVVHVADVASDLGSQDGIWLVVADGTLRSESGPLPGRLVRVDATGQVTRTIADASGAGFAITFDGTGGLAFGGGGGAGTAFARVLSVSGSRILLQAATGETLMAVDTAQAAAAIDALPLDLPTGTGTIADAVMDSAGRVYFLFGTTSAISLFVRNTDGSTASIPIPGRPFQLHIDADAVIVRARGASNSDPHQLFRVTPRA